MCPSRVSSSRPSAASHTRPTGSLPTVTSRAPSGENATPVVGPACPGTVNSSRPVSASNTRAVPPPSPAATRRPSAEKATDMTPPPRARGRTDSADPAGSHRTTVRSQGGSDHPPVRE